MKLHLVYLSLIAFLLYGVHWHMGFVERHSKVMSEMAYFTACHKYYTKSNRIEYCKKATQEYVLEIYK